MNIALEELRPVLSQFNPWWRGERLTGIPEFKRAAFTDLYQWMSNPPTHRAVLLSGARQVGKTTLILQIIKALMDDNVPPSNILYATFDHPLIKLAGFDAVLRAWRERIPKSEGPEFLFLDEAQYIADWGTQIKLQVDFHKNRRIAFTGSAMPLAKENPESGVGRWHTIKLTTLSFYEYLQIKEIAVPDIGKVSSLIQVFEIPRPELQSIAEIMQPYTAHFHEYLIRGGFPQTTLIDDISSAQRLLREDIIDKVLKRDMTALFGVRNVLELERTFLYLCMHNGGVLDIRALSSALEVGRATSQNYIEVLEAAHLIYKLPPYGYGKTVLRGQHKVYLADPSMAPAVLLRGIESLDSPIELGNAAEAAVFKHLFSLYYDQSVQFSYWRGKSNKEIDLIAERPEEIIPFEIKYRQQHTTLSMLQGLVEFMQEKALRRAYVVTKSLDDIGVLNAKDEVASKIMRIPAPLLCYWLGQCEPDLN